MLRQKTVKESEAEQLKLNVQGLLLVAEQALERGEKGEEFDWVAKHDLVVAIWAGKKALSEAQRLETEVIKEAVTEHRNLILSEARRIESEEGKGNE